MEILIFHSDVGQECNSYYLVSTSDDKDKATIKYLDTIGDFAWDKTTKRLQDKVEGGDYSGMFSILHGLVSNGYDCFRLDDTYGITTETYISINKE